MPTRGFYWPRAEDGSTDASCPDRDPHPVHLWAEPGAYEPTGWCPGVPDDSSPSENLPLTTRRQ